MNSVYVYVCIILEFLIMYVDVCFFFIVVIKWNVMVSFLDSEDDSFMVVD